MKSLHHLTLMTGNCRVSPRAEVDRQTIAFIRGHLKNGSGSLGHTGWAVLRLDAPSGGHCFDLSYQGVEVARCWLAATKVAATVMWPDAASHSTRVANEQPPWPWLAIDLLPDGMIALANNPQLLLELGDLERCVAWALLPFDA